MKMFSSRNVHSFASLGRRGWEGNVIGCFPFPQQGGVMVEVFTNIEGVKILMSVTLTRIFTMLITVSSNTIYIYITIQYIGASPSFAERSYFMSQESYSIINRE